MKYRIPATIFILFALFPVLSFAQRGELKYGVPVRVQLSAHLAAASGESVLTLPMLDRLASLPNFVSLDLDGNLKGGAVKATFIFRSIEAFNTWRTSDATRQLLDDIRKESPAGVNVDLAMGAPQPRD